MATSASCGVPWLVDGPPLDAGNPFRQFDVGCRMNNVGTATAVQVPGGVYPGLGAMQVTAGSGLAVQVAAGYCCVPSPTTGQGGYIFGDPHRADPAIDRRRPLQPPHRPGDRLGE